MAQQLIGYSGGVSHSKVEKKGPGLAKLQKLVAKLDREPECRVGIFAGGSRIGDEVSNVELGVIHEFGAPGAGIPERSFLRSTADRKRQEWLALMTRALGKAVDGKLSVEAAIDLIGLKAVADVKASITRGTGIEPPLKAATIRRKGSSRPLVDTSQLLNSIVHKTKV